MTITIEKSGRRYYIVGNTYSVKDRLRAAGCKWDPERKAWWTGKQDVAERIQCGLESVEDSRKSDSGVSDDTKLVAKAEYKGRKYGVAWMGMTKRGTEAAKLVGFDGKISFWKDASEITILKHYGREDYRSGRMEYPTLRSIRDFGKRAKEMESRGIERCHKCGGYHQESGCYMCGCTRCEGAHGGLCEDD